MAKKHFHPIFFALYPVLTLLSANVAEIPIKDSFRAILFSLLLVVLVLVFFQALLRNWSKSSLLTSLLLIVFFSYGHIYGLLAGIELWGIQLGRHSILLVVFGIVVILVGWWILFRLRDFSGVSDALNMVGLILFLMPTFSILNYFYQSIPVTFSTEEANVGEIKVGEECPDIYYIILDQYAREDVLSQKYGYDNSGFIDELERLGFYVAKESTSNYHSTLLSISSSLNMDYIDWLQNIYGVDTNSNEPFGELISKNQAFMILRESGYQLVAFKSGVYRTELRDADYFIESKTKPADLSTSDWPLNSFENLFLESTAARVLFDTRLIVKEKEVTPIEVGYELHRIEILHTFEHLSDFVDREGNYIIFVHIVSPHAPFVFGPNGEKIKHKEPYSLSPLGYNIGDEDYTQMYLDQMKYINNLVLTTVKDILQKSDRPPIIIIQSDHGTAGYAQKSDIPELNMKERHAILNAYYFPDGKTDLLYSTISPVNTFRVIFNTYFRGEYEMLPDRNYFNPSQRQFDYVDVTDRVKTDEVTPR